MWKSLWKASLHDADVVVVYGNKPIMDALGAKLSAELKEGAVVISNAFALPPRWLGEPTDAHYVSTGSVAWSFGLRDSSSHLLRYEQTAGGGGK